MAEKVLSKDFWDKRYKEQETGWDIGFPSPAIAEYVNQLSWRDKPVLIPGCGNAHEAEYLLKQGFSNLTVIDIAPSLTDALKVKFGEEVNKGIHIITGNFFDLTGEYELILEQTFFCALDPSLRTAYVRKMHSLLVKGGRLAGVLFNKKFDEDGPPFGGTLEAYQQLFAPLFTFKTLEPCYNSIEKRKDAELFINFMPK